MRIDSKHSARSDGICPVGRCVLLAVLLLQGPCAWGGLLLQPGVQWQVASFAPQAEEDTPSYLGIGPTLAIGYAFFAKEWGLELNGVGSYTPTRLSVAERSPFEHHASAAFVGGELALRLFSVAAVALRVGTVRHQVYARERDDEVDGRWEGLGYGLSVAGCAMTTREDCLALALDWVVAPALDQSSGSHDLESVDEGEASTRRYDMFAVRMSYFLGSLEKVLTPDLGE